MSKGKHFELLKTLDGHTDAVWGSCTSSKGDSLFTASWDGTVASWDIITCEQTMSMSGHKGKVFCVAAGGGNQGSVLVSGGEDRSIRSWNISDDGSCEGVLEDAHDGSVVSLNSSFFMYRSREGTYDHSKVNLIHLISKISLSNLVVFYLVVFCFLFLIFKLQQKKFDLKVLPSNKSESVVLMSVGSDAVMNIWTLEPGSAPSVHSIKDQHDGPIYTCAHDGRGVMLATGSSDTTIRIYDAETGSPVSLLGTMGTEMTSPELGHSSTVAGIEFFKRQPHLLISAGWDSSFKIWDTRKNNPCVMTTENCHSEIVSCCTALGTFSKKSKRSNCASSFFFFSFFSLLWHCSVRVLFLCSFGAVIVHL